MSILTKADILSADDLPTQTVGVPEWGGDVIVRSMTGLERDRFDSQLIAKEDGKTDLSNIKARLCSLCIVDESGERLFTEAEAVELGKKSAKALARVFEAASELNGLGAEEEIAGNSEAEPSEGSISD